MKSLRCFAHGATGCVGRQGVVKALQIWEFCGLPNAIDTDLESRFWTDLMHP